MGVRRRFEIFSFCYYFIYIFINTFDGCPPLSRSSSNVDLMLKANTYMCSIYIELLQEIQVPYYLYLNGAAAYKLYIICGTHWPRRILLNTM